MADGKKLIQILLILIGIFFYNCLSIAMEKPYHHFQMELLETQKGHQKETLMLNGLIKYLIRKKRSLI